MLNLNIIFRNLQGEKIFKTANERTVRVEGYQNLRIFKHRCDT
jgi:hypothetical protein